MNTQVVGLSVLGDTEDEGWQLPSPHRTFLGSSSAGDDTLVLDVLYSSGRECNSCDSSVSY